jgi:hypothetical protein
VTAASARTIPSARTPLRATRSRRKDETDPFKAVDVAWRDPGVTSYQSAMAADEPLSRFTTFA